MLKWPLGLLCQVYIVTDAVVADGGDHSSSNYFINGQQVFSPVLADLEVTASSTGSPWRNGS